MIDISSKNVEEGSKAIANDSKNRRFTRWDVPCRKDAIYFWDHLNKNMKARLWSKSMSSYFENWESSFEIDTFSEVLQEEGFGKPYIHSEFSLLEQLEKLLIFIYNQESEKV